MRLLIIQFTDPRQADPLPVFSHNLGVLAATLKADGFDSRLLTLGGYDGRRLKEAVNAHRPEYVLAELSPFSMTVAHRTIGEIAGQFSLPVVMLGPYATAKPAKVVSIPGVRALLHGEYLCSGPEFLRAVRAGRDLAGLPGVWLNEPAGLVKSTPGALAGDLDALPFPDREMFDYARIVHATHEAEFKATMGCPAWCAYCLNDWYMDLYEGKSGAPACRRRSVGNLLSEIETVLQTYDKAKSVAFLDHAFAADPAWLQQFSQEYPSRCKAPFRCHVPLASVTAETASALSAAGCSQARVHVGSGSRFIREEVLSMRLTDGQIVEGCRMLRQAGVPVTAEVFVGAPYESDITVAQTIDLLARARVRGAIVRLFHPVPGTRAAELCAENGWLSSRHEDGYWSNRAVLNLPSMSPVEADALAGRFNKMLRRRTGGIFWRLMGRLSADWRKELAGSSE